MTKKQYRTAQGKMVDMGALLLQNENVRAVGNMGVNARGDAIDSQNKVVDKRTTQVHRQYRRQTNVSAGPVGAGTVAVKKSRQPAEPVIDDTFDDLPEDNDVVIEKTVAVAEESVVKGGLAAAIAKSREIQQELEKKPTAPTGVVKKI
jgi:hypothetical protein